MSDVMFFDPNHPPFYQLISFKSVGTSTFYASDIVAPSSDYEVDYYLVTCYGGGEGGDRSTYSARGGRSGGRVARRLSVDSVGESQTVTVGAGGLGRSGSDGNGGAGGVSSFGNLVLSEVGTSVMETILGPIASSACPGRGGDAGMYSTDSGGSSTVYYYGPGEGGESSSGAVGGQGGMVAGFWGSGNVYPTSGADGVTFGWYTTGGGGGGGGTGGAVSTGGGGDGGNPGGGGGGSSRSNPGGNGGRGQVDVLAVFKPRDLSEAGS